GGREGPPGRAGGVRACGARAALRLQAHRPAGGHVRRVRGAAVRGGGGGAGGGAGGGGRVRGGGRGARGVGGHAGLHAAGARVVRAGAADLRRRGAAVPRGVGRGRREIGRAHV